VSGCKYLQVSISESISLSPQHVQATSAAYDLINLYRNSIQQCSRCMLSGSPMWSMNNLCTLFCWVKLSLAINDLVMQCCRLNWSKWIAQKDQELLALLSSCATIFDLFEFLC
jgi:hypothetical protein